MNPRLKQAILFFKKKYGIKKIFRIYLTDWLEKDCNGQIDFDCKVIEINSTKSLDNQILALFHECFHFLDWKTGEFDPFQKTYKSICFQEIPYFYQPHEIRARIESEKLLLEFNQFMLKKTCKKKYIVLG